MIHQMVLNVGLAGYSEETKNCLALQVRTCPTRYWVGVMLADVWLLEKNNLVFNLNGHSAMAA